MSAAPQGPPLWNSLAHSSPSLLDSATPALSFSVALVARSAAGQTNAIVAGSPDVELKTVRSGSSDC
jgi:hypothetical protein